MRLIARSSVIAAVLFGAAAVARSAQAEPSSTANAELLFMIEQLQQEVQMLRGVVEEQTHQLDQLKRQAKDRYIDLDRRILELSKQDARQPVAVPPVTTAPETTGKSPSTEPTAAASGSEQSATPSQSISNEQQREYDAAFALVKARDFEKAADAFHRFIAKYPDTDLTGNAYYWLGEVYLVIPKLEQAQQAFTVVVSRYQGHRKAPDAMFKLGVAYDKLGDKQNARYYLDEVVKRYPQSSAAKLAREYTLAP